MHFLTFGGSEGPRCEISMRDDPADDLLLIAVTRTLRRHYKSSDPAGNAVIEMIRNCGELVAAVQGITVEQIRDGFSRAMKNELAATPLSR